MRTVSLSEPSTVPERSNVPAICVEVDLPSRRIRVRLPEGLDEL